ncbi:hypothetical protein CLV46_1416 [Diaminobutyricimonas aerilata]|uniref:Uncharacterized protein n=1 Tax=Diaminobutyricimonas aerilata TaxID=1162967 RepID=A0A2M9CIZ9_9MICO|nr:hypothetical protein CLV46_1416 [Diaminobutyricimonas aerilata]
MKWTRALPEPNTGTIPVTAYTSPEVGRVRLSAHQYSGGMALSDVKTVDLTGRRPARSAADLLAWASIAGGAVLTTIIVVVAMSMP